MATPVRKAGLDFWDVEKFPGSRAYRGKVAGALAPAMMADGVPMDKVWEELDSEEGILRAINKVREFKNRILQYFGHPAHNMHSS